MSSPPAQRILVVDDEPQVREVLATILRNDGFDVATAADADEACRTLSAERFGIVFTDLRMPSGSGIDVLKHIRETDMNTLGVVMTAYGSFDSAIEAFRAHAFDYITKPLDMQEVRRLVHSALEVHSRRAPTARPRLKGAVRNGIAKRLVGASPPMTALNEQISTVAGSASTVLIRGESGTGKELVALALHHSSPRADRPLVPVNCGAIPEDLLESELFGHVRGSFTGAMFDRVGRFALANGGTIFLDEIGDMSPRLQVKILRVLQEQEVEPVGSADTIQVDVRVLAATNVDLERVVEEKRFREDLYYRLNVIPIHVAPLRERMEDMPLLIDYFIERFNKIQPRRIERFSPEAIDALMRYAWPGNVRELENLVERMTILARGAVVELGDLPEKFLRPGATRANGAATCFSPDRSTRVGAPGDGSAPFDAVRPGDEGLSVDERLSFSSDPPPYPSPPAEAPVSPLAFLESAMIGDEGIDLTGLVDKFERKLIIEALGKSQGVRSRAADLLGIKRTTLVEKMKKKKIVYKRGE